MTFPKWRSYSYKPLEPQHKRRNTIGAIRNTRRSQPSLVALSLSTSLNASHEISDVHDITREDDATNDHTTLAENGVTKSNEEHTLPDTFDLELSSTSTPPPPSPSTPTSRTRARSRSFSLGWTVSLRNRLSWSRRHNGRRQLRSSVSPSPDREIVQDDESPEKKEKDRESNSPKPVPDDSIPDINPESDAQLEVLLQDAWSTVLSVGEAGYTGFIRRKQALEYSRKMAELRHQYKLKLAEILQREATFVQGLLSHDESTPLLSADEMTVPMDLHRAVCEAQSRTFNKQRLELKRQTVASVLALQSRYPTVLAGRKGGEKNSFRPRSCHWSSRTLVYSNPHSEAVQSGSMVGICNGCYATENFEQPSSALE